MPPISAETSSSLPDPAKTATALARQFFMASEALDDFRLSFVPPLPAAEDQQLRAESDALESRAQYLTADAIGATLAHLQPQLARIQWATEQAKAQLNRLQTVDRAIELATSLLGLGAALSAGDPSAILAATEDLAGRL